MRSRSINRSYLVVILQTLLASWCLSLSIEPTHGFQVALPSVKVGVGITSCQKRHHATSRRLVVAPSLSKLSLSDTNEDSDYETSIDPATKAEIRNIANHLSKQTLESLLSPSEARAITNELLFDNESKSSIFNDNSYEQYVKYSKKVEKRLREENQRTPADLLGNELTDRILASIRGDGKGSNSGYDAQTVNAFLESDAVNSLFTQLLYDAIFEFTTKFDILGNAISNLPLLGPVRNQVLKESKRNMDRTLGPLLQRFLSGYTRVATRQAVDFVVSEENASAFGKANAKLVSYLLQKQTVADWLPDEKTLGEWREEVWAYLVGLEEGDGNGEESIKVKEDQKMVVEQGIEYLYDLVGDKCVEDGGVDVNDILDASPTLEGSLGRFWRQCQDSA